uniref:EF-hand domain-containing protein n=1 Tax=Eutreptiella gymnastica TaxID=73025 RepID=A0A7S1IN52_9EUGL|mmetsp:Transcript_29779/g.53527  ORF Transcript_29779/g.53527 Transcript_29779/m.53527 type:complete len:511 (+) Transcript_29779:136-1668(+)
MSRRHATATASARSGDPTDLASSSSKPSILISTRSDKTTNRAERKQKIRNMDDGLLGGIVAFRFDEPLSAMTVRSETRSARSDANDSGSSRRSERNEQKQKQKDKSKTPEKGKRNLQNGKAEEEAYDLELLLMCITQTDDDYAYECSYEIGPRIKSQSPCQPSVGQQVDLQHHITMIGMKPKDVIRFQVRKKKISMPHSAAERVTNNFVTLTLPPKSKGKWMPIDLKLDNQMMLSGKAKREHNGTISTTPSKISRPSGIKSKDDLQAAKAANPASLDHTANPGELVSARSTSKWHGDVGVDDDIDMQAKELLQLAIKIGQRSSKLGKTADPRKTEIEFSTFQELADCSGDEAMALFSEIDTNGSGSITRMEIICHLHKKACDVAQTKGTRFLQQFEILLCFHTYSSPYRGGFAILAKEELVEMISSLLECTSYRSSSTVRERSQLMAQDMLVQYSSDKKQRQYLTESDFSKAVMTSQYCSLVEMWRYLAGLHRTNGKSKEDEDRDRCSLM